MNSDRKYIRNFGTLMIMLIISCIIGACNGGGGDSSSGGGTSDSDTTVSLGVLSNGSSVQSSSGSFTLSSGSATTGTIGLSDGTAGYTGVMTMAVSSANSSSLTKSTTTDLPTVTMSPTPCVLTAGSTNQVSCQYTISAASDVLNGNYIITPTFTPNTGTPQTLNSITLTVSGGATPTTGSLSIIVDNNALAIGESAIATITLSGSIGVSDLSVSVFSSDTSIFNVTPSSCTLSTANNNCQVVISGESQGMGYVRASATGYTTASSAEIVVYSTNI